MEDPNAVKIAALQELQTNKGWELVSENLKEELKDLEATLYGYKPLAEGETIQGIQKEAQRLRYLIDLPAELIEQMTKVSGEEDTSDPYS